LPQVPAAAVEPISAPASKGAKEMKPQCWEYNVLFLSNERDVQQVQDAMNDLGAHGWELIAVTPAGDNAKIFFFKRPLE
jgi:hypothetical protein